MTTDNRLESLLERDPGYLREVWAWFGIGVTIILLRFLVRIRMGGWKGLEADDCTIIMVLAMYTADAVLVDLLYMNGTNVDVPQGTIDGLTDAEISQLAYGSKLQLAAWYSYTALIWSMKATMLLFYNRLTPFGLWQRRALRYLAIFTAVAYIAVVLTISLGCQPYSHNWQVRPLPAPQCTVKRQNFVATAILNVLTDAAILCIPLPMLKQLKATFIKKILIAILLCSGLFVITAAILRAAVTLGSKPSSLTINLWGVRETIIGIIAINAPVLRPLFRHSFWFPGSSQKRSGSSESHAQSANNRSPVPAKGPVFNSKGSKKSRSDSAAFGVNTNVTGFSMIENRSVELLEEEQVQGHELPAVKERTSEEYTHNAGGTGSSEHSNVVFVDRTFDVRETNLQIESPFAGSVHEQAPKGTTTTDISARATSSPKPEN